MTPHLWLLVYISVVLVLGAIAIGWTDGVWRRHQDEREARQERWDARAAQWNAELDRLWQTFSAPSPERVAKGTAFGGPVRRTFKHRNLRVALNNRAQIERGAR